MKTDELLCPIALMRSHRDSSYLAFVRTQPCCISGLTTGVVAHHVRMMGGGGVGLKPSDYLSVPLHHEVHQKLHSQGEGAFWAEKDVRPVAVMERLLTQCVQPGTDLDALFKTQTAIVCSDGKLRALIEAVADWRQTK